MRRPACASVCHVYLAAIPLPLFSICNRPGCRFKRRPAPNNSLSLSTTLSYLSSRPERSGGICSAPFGCPTFSVLQPEKPPPKNPQPQFHSRFSTSHQRQKQVVNSKFVPRPATALSLSTTLSYVVIPTGAKRRGGICSAPFGCPTYSVPQPLLLCPSRGSRPLISQPEKPPPPQEPPNRNSLPLQHRDPTPGRVEQAGAKPLPLFSFPEHQIPNKPADLQFSEPPPPKNPQPQFRSPFSSICTTSAHHPHPRNQPSGLN
jgi:hypothetical protein